MTSLTKPDPKMDPAYYLIPDAEGAPKIPYLFRATQDEAGNTVECNVVVKAREAGFSRYVVTCGEVELLGGDTPAGPWKKVCEHRYSLQWQDGEGAWCTVATDQLSGLRLAFVESEEHVEVELTGKVKRPEGSFVLTSCYGVDLSAREFLAEDRFQCAGLKSDGEARPVRLVQKVGLAQDHPDLAEPEEDQEIAAAMAGIQEKRIGSLRVGWRRHARRTGDRPHLSVDKPAKELSVIYHVDGATEALDVDPHVVLDDANNNSIVGERSIGRTAAGETAIIFADATTPRVRLAYTTTAVPTQTSDWSFVTLAGEGGLLASQCGGYWPGIYWCSLCLDERSGWLHVAWNDYTNKACYAKCDVSAGISAVVTASNWRKADNTQGYDQLLPHYNDSAHTCILDTNSEGKPFITYRGSTHTAAYHIGFRKWDGTQWTDIVVLFSTTYVGWMHSSTIDSEDVIWVFALSLDDTPNSIAETHCAFDEAHVSGNWSSETTVVKDEAKNAEQVSCCCDGSGTPYVFGAVRLLSPHLGWFNWHDGSSWVQGTGSGSGLEKSLSAVCQWGPTGGGDAAGNVFFIYSWYAATYQRNSSDTFATENGSYGGDPADYDKNSFEQRQLSSDDKLYGAGAEGGDIYFQYLTTASGNPWWKDEEVPLGGNGFGKHWITLRKSGQGCCGDLFLRPASGSLRMTVGRTYAARGLNVPAEFYYDSRNLADEMMGHRWERSLGGRVRPYIQVDDPSGDSQLLYDTPPQSYSPVEDDFDELDHLSDGSWQEYFDDVEAYFRFDSSGRPTEVVDLLGNAVYYDYDGGARLSKLRGSAGREIDFAHDALGYVESATDWAGRTTYYYHDGTRHLQRVVGPELCMHYYTYDCARRVVGIEDPEGCVVYFGYDQFDRLTSETIPGFGTTYFAYPGERQLSVTDPRGNTTEYVHSAYDAIVRLIDPLGYRQENGWSDGKQTSVTDKLGRTTYYVHDQATKRVAEMTTPCGVTEYYTYDANRRRASDTNFRGYTTYYDHDFAHNLLWARDPLGHVTYHEYDATGLRTSTKDARGNTTEFSHDAYGHQTQQENALGDSRYFEYDSADRQVKVVDERGLPTYFEYNDHDNVTKAIDALGNYQETSYDGNQHPTTVRDTRGFVTYFAYNCLGLQSRVTDALGQSSYFSYDGAGDLTAVADPRGCTTTHFSSIPRVWVRCGVSYYGSYCIVIWRWVAWIGCLQVRGLSVGVDLDHDAQPHRREAESSLTCMYCVPCARVRGPCGARV